MTLPTFGKADPREDEAKEEDSVEDDINSKESEDGDRREDGAFSYVTPLELKGGPSMATAPFSSDIAALTPDSIANETENNHFDFKPIPPKRLSKVLGDYDVELSTGYRNGRRIIFHKEAFYR